MPKSNKNPDQLGYFAYLCTSEEQHEKVDDQIVSRPIDLVAREVGPNREIDALRGLSAENRVPRVAWNFFFNF